MHWRSISKNIYPCLIEKRQSLFESKVVIYCILAFKMKLHALKKIYPTFSPEPESINVCANSNNRSQCHINCDKSKHQQFEYNGKSESESESKNVPIPFVFLVFTSKLSRSLR